MISLGPSIKYVRKFFGFFDPSPPCMHFGLNHKTKFTQPRLLRPHLGLHPPLPLSAYVLNGSPLSGTQCIYEATQVNTKHQLSHNMRWHVINNSLRFFHLSCSPQRSSLCSEGSFFLVSIGLNHIFV